jgi:hypothetical protein
MAHYQVRGEAMTQEEIDAIRLAKATLDSIYKNLDDFLGALVKPYNNLVSTIKSCKHDFEGKPIFEGLAYSYCRPK